jgi:hypothetical protein
VQLGVFEFETFLGLWLLFGKRQQAAWLLAMVTFLSFAVVSAYQGFVGQASCGCFGQVSVSPFYALAVDLAVLVLLSTCRPALAVPGMSLRCWLWQNLWPTASNITSVVAAFVVLVGAASFCFGSVGGAIAYLRGEPVSVSPRFVDVGTGAPGEVKIFQVEVTNWTGKPVRLIGGTNDCSCNLTIRACK